MTTTNGTYVAVSWDDVKVMTLEQLDDAFRLDIVSSDTPVWQNGMSGWEPLGKVAGIGGGDDDDEEDSQADVLTEAELEVVFPPFPAPVPLKQSAVRSARPTPSPPRPPSRAPAPIAAASDSVWPSLAPVPAPRPAPAVRPAAIAPVITLAPRPVATARLIPPADSALASHGASRRHERDDASRALPPRTFGRRPLRPVVARDRDRRWCRDHAVPQ
jgi:hypothetical protein